MADAFTVNSTASMGEWTVIDAYSADVSTAQALLADKAGHSYLVKGFTVTMDDTDGRWFKIFDDAVIQVGPVRSYNRPWPIRYESAVRFDGAINVQTEANRPIHITMDYRIIPS